MLDIPVIHRLHSMCYTALYITRESTPHMKMVLYLLTLTIFLFFCKNWLLKCLEDILLLEVNLWNCITISHMCSFFLLSFPLLHPFFLYYSYSYMEWKEKKNLISSHCLFFCCLILFLCVPCYHFLFIFSKGNFGWSWWLVYWIPFINFSLPLFLPGSFSLWKFM